MKSPHRGFKVLILIALTGAVAAAIALNKAKATAKSSDAVAMVIAAGSPGVGSKSALPRLVDLGASKCIPCKKMAPILEELKKENAGRMEVQFIDVWQNPDAGKAYGIEMIPTQIFYDAGGREMFRHVGFFAKEDILAKWKELGVVLTSPGGSRM